MPPRRLRRARVAAAALFFTNGAIFASVVPRYPDIKRALGLSNAALGSAVSGYWLGALLVGLTGGTLIRRFGSGRVAAAVTVGAAANLSLVAHAPTWWALAAALFLAGSLDVVADIAENAHALAVERGYGRSILNSLHGVWSIGAVTGGALGAVAAGLRVGLGAHLAVAGAVSAVVALVASRWLLPGDHEPAPAPSRVRAGRRRRRSDLALGIAALGVFATLAQGIEDTAATWSSVYLREDLGAGAAVAGLGFVALQAVQTVGRLLGDRSVTRYGDRAVARAGALVAGAALALALAVPSVPGTVLAFGAAGLGIATLLPAAMRHADALPGLAAGTGLTLVGAVSRVGSLVAPPAIGVVADAAGLRVALLVVPVAAVALLLLSPALATGRTDTASERVPPR